MNLRLPLAISLVALAASMAGAASAADYDPPIYTENTPEYTPVEIGSGWYLRGDVGYTVDNNVGGANFRTYDALTTSYGDDGEFDSWDMDKNMTWGGGVGYRFNDWLRADATVDGFRADFDGTSSAANPCSTDIAFLNTNCRSEGGAEMSAVSVMANGYVDLGTYVGLTPYVGAGAGMTYVSWSDLESDNFCVDGVAVCPAPGGVVNSETRGGKDDWRFTYAVMAGVAYDLTPNMKLDLGYKYRHIDGGGAFGWDAANAAAGASGSQVSSGDIEQHEVKVGLRYELW